MDNNNEITLSLECTLSSNVVKPSSAGNISTINNNINQQSQSVTDKTKVYKEVNTLNNKIIDEI